MKSITYIKQSLTLLLTFTIFIGSFFLAPEVQAVWDISSASYDSVSFSVVDESGNLRGLAFKDDGTKMYLTGVSSDKVFQYSLSIAWDISTASFNNASSSVSAEETSPQDVAFKGDGTKMYVVGTNNDAVFQYSLSPAWDVSTASYDNASSSMSAEDNAPVSLAFKDDGNKMYVLGFTNLKIFQYSLTAWDISTASYDSVSFSVGDEDIAPIGLAFKDDGTKVYIMGNTNHTVYQYSLSTAWDISTASYDSVSFDVSNEETNTRDVAFKSDGSKMYVFGLATDKVYQYSLAQSLGRRPPPAFRFISREVTDITSDSAVVSWNTSIPTDIRLNWSTSRSEVLGQSAFWDFELKTSHSVSLENLSPGTTYYYVIHAAAPSRGNIATGSWSFTTLPASLADSSQEDPDLAEETTEFSSEQVSDSDIEAFVKEIRKIQLFFIELSQRLIQVLKERISLVGILAASLVQSIVELTTNY